MNTKWYRLETRSETTLTGVSCRLFTFARCCADLYSPLVPHEMSCPSCHRKGLIRVTKLSHPTFGRAGVFNVRPGVHILRHTFCSHLAMKGAPARAIQELAGHQDLGTTQRYMHLSPSAIERAIRLLDQARM